jgi:uncharacterized repeat protein (TIGR03803 family)
MLAALCLCASGPQIAAQTPAIKSPATTFSSLFSFDGTDGEFPELGALVQGTDGNFYGTTRSGGLIGNGTVFKITASGTLTTLHNFDGTDGTAPNALVQATNGNFYGTTAAGGASGHGTVFEISPSGMLTTLASFNLTDGANPEAGLIQATDGNFYGTTSRGGANHNCPPGVQ